MGVKLPLLFPRRSLPSLVSMMCTPPVLVKPEPEKTSSEPSSCASRRLMLSLPQISGHKPTSCHPHSFSTGKHSKRKRRRRSEEREMVREEEEAEAEETEEEAAVEVAEAEVAHQETEYEACCLHWQQQHIHDRHDFYLLCSSG